MHRVLATLLATALGAPPGDAPATEADTPADAAHASEPGTEPEPEPEPGTETAPEAEGLPSVEDPPEEATPPPHEPEPEPAPEPAQEPEGPAPLPPVAPPPGRDRLGCDFSKSCRQLTITGTVLGSIGLAAVGTGIALFVRDDEVLADEPAYAKSTKPPGLVALTLGSGVVVTSILMLVASHRGAKDGAKEQGVARWLSPRGGRF